MKTTETAHVFSCEGEELIAILHSPDSVAETGFIAVPAGSVQYRAGSGRQLVNLARELSANGYPVLRFDYRGMGDSSGNYRGFRHIEAELRAAVQLLKAQVPELEKIVIYGGCEAASGIMMHAASVANLGGIALANPWVGDERLTAAALRVHYFRRLGEKEFWLKLLKGKYAITSYMSASLRAVWKKLRSVSEATAGVPEKQTASNPRPFQEDMLEGLVATKCPVLLLMSGGSLLRQEFEELLRESAKWRKAVGRSNCTQMELPEADQTFSTANSKRALASALLEWVGRA
jgi:exosortase A-associated hydrolase 1